MSDDIQILESELQQYEKYEIPDNGIFPLGPRNRSALKRFSYIVCEIVKRKTELPQNPFLQYIALRVTSKDKQDFSMMMTGRKGLGKSYSSLRIASELAKLIAKIKGGSPDDFFTLQNCALLEDSEGINQIIKYAGLNQIILIDDAGVAVGSRDFATQKNKNFNALLSTCRTKRWVIILNVPAKSHIDKQIRELVDCWARVYTKMHDIGFNILKINSVEINENNANKPYGRRYTFEKKKIGMYAVLSPDKAMAEEYDKRRDAAAQKLIDAAITGDEAPKLTKRDIRKQEMLTKFSETIITLANEGASSRSIRMKCPGLSETMLTTLRAELGV